MTALERLLPRLSTHLPWLRHDLGAIAWCATSAHGSSRHNVPWESGLSPCLVLQGARNRNGWSRQEVDDEVSRSTGPLDDHMSRRQEKRSRTRPPWRPADGRRVASALDLSEYVTLKFGRSRPELVILELNLAKRGLKSVERAVN